MGMVCPLIRTGDHDAEGDANTDGGGAGERQGASGVTIATSSNMPMPPVYRGSTKKEKKAFMDSYLVYQRLVTALNQGSFGHVFVMPLSACIEHRTLVSI
ncbi:hypothetical protein PI124_g10791 [Phytophthora idaei]|nr:hypothetical protein PI125_g8412 [Phytophthora idaei]KAG3156610.1 hypothetical protein PI126_g8693 [Phytophthora idaei]KAG3244453.1 hypothetical protein PI124_g10791 [Phytophthora idaei]